MTGVGTDGSRDRCSTSTVVGHHEEHTAERGGWDHVATAADCYKFACETGIITADELFLGDMDSVPHGCLGDEEDAGGPGSRGGKRAVGKKRSHSGRDEEEGKEGSPCGEDAGAREGGGASSGSPPRVLHEFSMVTERLGTFLENFPFQSFVREDDEKIAAAGPGKITIGVRGGEGVDRRILSSLPIPVACPPLVVDDPSLLPTDRAAARLSRAVLLRRGFTLVAECMSGSARGHDMASLIVAEGLWSRGVHLLLIYSLLWPWAGGLLPRPCDGEEVEKCESFEVVMWVDGYELVRRKLTIPV